MNIPEGTSINELRKLKAEIDHRLKVYIDTKIKNKTDAFPLSKIVNEFKQDIEEKGITDDYWYHGLDSHIFWLCDLAFMNYEVKEHKRKGINSTYISISRYPNTPEDFDTYKSMADEIWEIVQKYHKIVKEKKQ